MASADRLIEVFNEAKARPAGTERDQFLSEACRDEPELKEQVLSLLQAHEGAGDFLKNTQVIPPVTVLTEKPGDRIGRYKLLQKIGEGGCGVVYMAEQEEPVRRRVAFKVIKLGMDTKQVVARFEAEGQALALMDHPNIAKVFDAGATDTGRPYFVMELVRGIKITEYCDQNHLPTEARLNLFKQVCHAIQHAHQKGIIHRDIKPSNILVTINDGAPVPKVIDFGIAKAIEQRLTDKTVFTAFEQFIGTPAYMSPEQAELTSLDIDTRADIYSLGVLLYELLSGNTPFDAEKLVASGVAEIRRIIREQEPPKPSTRLNTLSNADLSTVAQHRHTDPPKLLHLIRGDLDWIVMKCLEKDRTRRYETANGLAMDLQRYLDDEPVIARPPSTAYRFQKLIRRHKLAFAAASAVAAALVLGLGLATWMFFKERQAHQRAVAAEQEQARLRRQAEAEVAESRRVAKFLGTLAESLRAERNLTNSESAYRESLVMWKRLSGDEHREVDAALNSLVRVLQQQGKLAEAGTTAREAAQKYETSLDQYLKLASDRNRHQECWSFACSYEAVGQLLQDLGQTQEAEKAYRDNQVLWRKMVAEFNLEDDRWHLANNYDLLGNLLKQADRLTESLGAYRDAHAVWLKLVADFNKEDRRWHLANNDDVIGRLLQEASQFDEATEVFRQSLSVWRKMVAEFNKDDYRKHLSWTRVNLAKTLQAADKRTEAELLFREAESAIREDLVLRQQRFGDVHREVESALGSLAGVLRDEGKLLEAEVVQRKELAMEKKLSGEEHLFVANSLQALGFVLRDSHNPDQAEVMFREALGMRRKLLGNENPLVASSLYWLGTALSVQGKHAEAEAAYREALEIRRKLPVATQLQVANLLDSLGQEIRLQGKHADAEPLYREALAIRRKLLGNQHPDVAISLENLAYELRLQGKRAEGEALYREALAMRRRLLGNEHPSVATSFSYVISALREDGRLEEAEALLRDELVQVQTPGTNAPAQVSARLGFALYSLAGVRRERKSLNEARSLAEEAYTLYQRYPDWPELQRRQASWVLRLVLTDLGDSAGLEALELRKLNDLRARVSDLRARRPADDPQLAAACSELLGTLHLAKKFAEAEPLYRELLASREAMIPDDWRTFNTRSILGDCLLGQTNYAAAEPLLLSGYEGMKQREDKIPAASKRHVKETIQRLVKLYEATDQPEKAAEWKKKLAEFNQAEAENVYRELLPLRSKLSADDPQLAAALARLTQTLLAQGKFDVAESLARECLSIREKKLPDDWLTFNARSMLGTSLLLQTDYDAAEPLLISGYEGMRQRMDKIPAGSKRYVKETGQRLVQLYEATDKPEQAAEWKKKLADFNRP